MPLASGARLGPYEVLGLIGAGGMGEVYKARDTRLDRTVAIKVLPAHVSADPERRAQFEREARAASALNHPNIVTIHDIDREADVDFIAMEYVPGAPLHQVIPQGGLPIEQALDYGVQIARALAAAHGTGIVHRDVKPANVLVSSSGHVKVVDFGLARKVVEAIASGASTSTALAVSRDDGSISGTPGYMAPEQVSGQGATARSDVFALGTVLHEMLSGHRAFHGSSTAAVLAAVLYETPPPLRAARRDVPPDLERIVTRCLAKEPDARYRSAVEALADLLICQKRLAERRVRLGVLVRRPAVVIPVVMLLITAAAAGTWFWVQQSRVRWARTVALPEAARLVGQQRNFPALRLLRQAERYVPDDPALQRLVRESTHLAAVTTTPPGAEVYVREYLDAPDAWEHLGRAPIENARLPAGLLVWKVSLQGFQTKEALAYTQLSPIRFVLRPDAEAQPGMVEVRPTPAAGTPGGVEAFWMDKYEVINRQFKDFIDRGGYDREEYWREALADRARPLSFDEARRAFHDRTGRPGPATWEVGGYPDGRADYPVGGVSWYEAAAYCRSVNKALPTVHHWQTAAVFAGTTEVVSYSRFGATDSAPVGDQRALGFFGTYDMAGNIKEWTWNATGSGEHRYLLGGGWNEPSYMFSNPDAQHPFERLSTYGFRCAKYDAPLAPSLLEPVEQLVRDYRGAQPIGQDTYRLFESLYRYDPAPLDATIELTSDAQDYARIEHVSFTAAYGSERVPAVVFLPRTGTAPYQAVVYFPGSNVYFEPGPFGFVEREQRWFLYLVRSGRAVIVPIYKGSFERKMGSVLTPLGWRDALIHGSKDLGRTIDYLETRSDIDARKLAYYGLSSGAAVGPLMTALEPRFKASILLGGGLYSWPQRPEANAFNFLSRVTVPTLMINGRHDFFFPLETSQGPMFARLGTRDKRHRVFESGHVPNEWQEVMKEVLDWLDGHLGSVGGADSR